MSSFSEKQAELRRMQAGLNQKYGEEIQAHETKLRLAMAQKEVRDVNVSLTAYRSEMERAQMAVFDILERKGDFQDKYKDISPAAMAETMVSEEAREGIKDLTAEQFERFKSIRGTQEWEDALANKASDLEYVRGLVDQETQRYQKAIDRMNDIKEEMGPVSLFKENLINIKNAAIRNAGNAYYEARIGLNELMDRATNAFAYTLDSVKDTIKNATDRTRAEGLSAYAGVANKADLTVMSYHKEMSKEYEKNARAWDKAVSFTQGLGDKIKDLCETIYGLNLAKKEKQLNEAQSLSERLGGIFTKRAEKASERAIKAKEKYDGFMAGRDNNGVFVNWMKNMAAEQRQYAAESLDRAMECCRSVIERETRTHDKVKDTAREGNIDVSKNIRESQDRYSKAQEEFSRLNNERQYTWAVTPELIEASKEIERSGIDIDSMAISDGVSSSLLMKQYVIASNPELIYDIPSREIDEETLAYAMINGEVDFARLELPAKLDIDKASSKALELCVDSCAFDIEDRDGVTCPDLSAIKEHLLSNTKNSKAMSIKINDSCEMAAMSGQGILGTLADVAKTGKEVLEKAKEISDEAWDQSR